MKRSFERALTLLIVIAGVLPAAAADRLSFDRFRAYLIWEDNGKLSKNIAKRTDQVIANGEEGSSTQVLVDLVVAGGKNAVYEESPLLLVWVTDPLDSSRPALVDKGWSISYVGLTGETVRSIIVDHDCNPVTLHARIDIGDTLGREFTKELNITCGD